MSHIPVYKSKINKYSHQCYFVYVFSSLKFDFIFNVNPKKDLISSISIGFYQGYFFCTKKPIFFNYFFCLPSNKPVVYPSSPW